MKHIFILRLIRKEDGSLISERDMDTMAEKDKKKKLMRGKQEERYRQKRKLNNDLIAMYRKFLDRSEPLSDAWCDCYNALQLELYHAEILEERR